MNSKRLAPTLLAAVLAGCAPAPGAEAPITLSEAEAQTFATTGERTAGVLAQTLIGQLQSALSARGPAGAVEFCSLEAAALTAQVSAEQGMTVKRTSFRFRNPDNAPDDLEAEALRRFEGSTPGSAGWVQAVSASEVRYYKPLHVLDFCLQCHGSESDLAEGVPELLEVRYPEDRATGYAAGDFRGVIRVSMPWIDPESGR